ncbi:MAG: undecaprenyl-diphosphate phosphatase [Candidatus Pacebacteria bacterium]|nr:undecaprenyl-diphosphate phosphatase [Candidatus Paceibacterota bacterium]
MLEGFVMGAIQGIAEWLPLSSDGLVSLAGVNFFGKNYTAAYSMAVFLHIGTFFAALIYLRKDVFSIFKKENRQIFNFLFLSTLFTGVVSVPLVIFAEKYFADVSSGVVSGAVGIFLIITGLALFRKKESEFREVKDVNFKDGVIAGILQGFSSLPGLSRSGLTIASLLFRRFNDTDALKLSFLMSLPAVFCANVFFFISGRGIEIGISGITGVLTSFVFGLLTMGFLFRLSKKINFGWFAVSFGFLVLLSAFSQIVF